MASASSLHSLRRVHILSGSSVSLRDPSTVALELLQVHGRGGVAIRPALQLRRGFAAKSVSGLGFSRALIEEQRTMKFMRRQFLVTSGATAAVVALSSAGATPSAGAAAQDVSTAPQAESEGGIGKTVFVAGATGNTGKRIVKELLRKGFRVRAGCRDIAKARQALPSGSDEVDFVLADVTQGVETLARAIQGVDAVVVATGFRPSFTDPFASWNVDNLGTVALVDAANKAGVKRFVLVSSLLVNGAAVGQYFNPAYIILNLLGLTLIAKLQAEKYIRQSGIEYTIIRPGGLKNDPPSGNLVLAPEDTLFAGSVSRDSVAEIAVDSLLYPEASFKVVELIAEATAPAKSVQQLLAAIPA